MPTVPIIDNPTQQLDAGGMQPFVAPGVEPMKNFAPEQAIKMGQATQHQPGAVVMAGSGGCWPLASAVSNPAIAVARGGVLRASNTPAS